MAMSHANCTHPRTPTGRRACRNAVPGVPYVPVAPISQAEADRQERAMNVAVQAYTDEIRMTGAVARRMARQAAKADRIQPRRSGARVAARSATCVQAALHIDAHGGRCACGWEAAA